MVYSEFAFQTHGKEGAVLVMPEGAISEDLHNHKLMQCYSLRRCQHRELV